MRRNAGALSGLLIVGALLACVISGCAGVSSARSVNTSSSPYITTDGRQFLIHGQPIKLNGYTFYPTLAGGTAAWDRPSFTGYVDHMLDMGLSAGQNLARPTDYWSKTNAQQTWNDPVIWANMDYLVQTAQKRGMFVLMDLSAYKWLLMSQGKDPYSAVNWIAFLRFVGARYSNATGIAAYSIVGEPPPPTTQAQATEMVAFYRTLTDTLYQADPHHLIAAGGFDHMEDAPSLHWWQQIYALPHDDIVTFKTYSQRDLNLMPDIASYAASIHKPLMDEEFGMPQYTGDGSFTGVPYNGIQSDRAVFFQMTYSEGEQLGVDSFIFWNLGCQLGDQSYEVSPETAAVWQVVARHAAVPAVTWPSDVAMC